MLGIMIRMVGGKIPFFYQAYATIMLQCRKTYFSLMVLISNQRNRQFAEEMPFTAAVENAVVYCIRHDIPAEFLIKNRAGQ